ncbi:hypothetical protein, partial [Klebsiella pneumoniae]|uniref:hypothetical protein n=1 Tax=Klebsiella pneumoniae TaxID=573 RepID=UPI0038555BD1
ALVAVERTVERTVESGADTASEAAGEDNTARDDALHLHFALGKALEDAADQQGAFAHYDRGNRLRRAMLRYDPDGQ